MSKIDRTITGTILNVEHAGTSGMGNPTYRIILADGTTHLTQANGSIGYAASNFLPHSSEISPRVNVLHLTRAGRVVNITGPDRSDALQADRDGVRIIAETFRAEADYVEEIMTDDAYTEIYTRARSVIGEGIIDALASPELPGFRATPGEFRDMAADEDTMRDVLRRAREIANA